MGVGHREPSGVASVESSPDPIGARREPPRYADTPAPEPPVAGFSAAAGPGPISGTEPRAIGAAYNEGGPAHRGRISSFNSTPAPRADGKYEVQPNDSYWAISEKLYGSGAYFKALAELNRGKGAGEDLLRPGELISAPAVAQLEQSYPDLCPKPNHREGQLQQSQSRTLTVSTGQQFRSGRTYTVAEGDTLFNIARYELGKASRWVEIYEMNRHVLGKDFNYLTPGIQLALPESEKPDTLTRRPGGTYTR
jgi:nucleoid-associated protein YgaU